MSIYDSTQLIKLETIEILPHLDKGDEAKDASQILQFKCTLCPLQFNEKQEFQSHVRDHFNPITCSECDKTLIGDKQYDYHLKHVHNQKIEMSENEIKSDDSNVPRKRANDPSKSIATSVGCDICGRLFPHAGAVERHRRTHSIEGKRYICGVCGNGFNKKTNLEFHMRIHTNERPFACDQCPKSFAHVSGLNCHRRVHSGERPYKCPFCTRCFAHSTDLRRHRRTHGLEEKRFACGLCEKQFYESKFLRCHMRTHHEDGNNVVRTKSIPRNNVISTQIEISKLHESSSEEYVDYEFIHSD